ncbi:MAG: NAD(P)H-hydrate epimerase, partial [Gemmobacter sp.]
MRAIEAAAIASGAVTGLELMERAGAGVVAAVLEEWPSLADGLHRAVVLCGPGGNGGDGFVVARLLRERGWEVEVFLYGDPARMPPDARVNYERWVGMGEVGTCESLCQRINAALGLSADLVVDALFGVGLKRALPLPVADVFCDVFRGYLIGRMIAVDVPSGLCADSGRPLVPMGYDPKSWPAMDGLIAEPDLTVTFHRRKQGHLLNVGPRHCGRVVVAQMGLAPGNGHCSVGLLENATGAIPKGNAAHKFSHGHALILSGPPGHGGAARLAARGALRIGAGVVTVGAPPDAIPEHAAHLNAIMLRAVGDGAALARVLEDRRITALCLGPGLGVDARAAGLVAVALESRGGGPPPRGGGGGGGGGGAPRGGGGGGGRAPPAPAPPPGAPRRAP